MKNKADLLDEAQSVITDKLRHEEEATRLQSELGSLFVQIHDMGVSDQEVATYLGKLSRTRVQQLRTSAKNV